VIEAPSAAFEAEERTRRGARPVLRLRFYPYRFDAGVGEGRGTYTDCHYRDFYRVQVDAGKASATWTGPALATGLAETTSAAPEWTTEGLGYEVELSYRTAATEALLASASWETMVLETEVSLQQYYQVKIEFSQVACYFTDSGAGGGEQLHFTDDAPWAGWFMDSESDEESWVEAVRLAGEYPLAPEWVISGGSLDLQAPVNFSDLVSGSYTAILKDRDGRFDPAGENFLWADYPEWWQGLGLRVYFGYEVSGGVSLIKLYEGQVISWGHRTSVEAGGQVLRQLEIYTEDGLTLARQIPLGAPGEDGKPRPMIHGELVLEATEQSESLPWEPTIREDFETGAWQLSGVITSGDGTFEVTAAAAFQGQYGARAAVSGGSAAAYGQMTLSGATAQAHAALRLRLINSPGSPTALNTRILWLTDSNGAEVLTLSPDELGNLWVRYGSGNWRETDYSLTGNAGKYIAVALGYLAGSAGQALLRLWIDGSQVLDVQDEAMSLLPKTLNFGLINGGAAEAWKIDFDSVEFSNYWYPCWYRLGGKFQDITEVWADNLLIPREVPKISAQQKWLQKMTKKSLAKPGREVGSSNYLALPDQGVIIWDDWTDPPGGQVMARVRADEIKNPVDILAALAEKAGLATDAANLATAKALVDEQYFCKFEDTTVGDALAALGAASLLTIWIEGGQVRCRAPAAIGSPVVSLTAADGQAVETLLDSREIASEVTVRWGWFERNNQLSYTAQNQAMRAWGIYQAQSMELDLSYGNQVGTESAETAKAKADYLINRLGGLLFCNFQGRLNLVRIELGDVVSWQGNNWLVVGKTVNLERPWGVNLKLVRFLGDER